MSAPGRHAHGARQWALSGAVALVATAVLAGFALRLLNARCESFACFAIGIAWMLWLAFYLPVLALLHLARARVAQGGAMARALRIGLLLAWAGGLALLVKFLAGRFA